MTSFRRTVAALATLIPFAFHTGASLAQEVSCATAISAMPVQIPVTTAELIEAYEPPDRLGSFNIVVVPGSGLSGNAAALAAFERAAAQWEAYFSDPITVTINADLVTFGGSTTVIGSTASVELFTTYTNVRAALINDASDEADDAIIASLPVTPTFLFNSAGFTYSGSITAHKANFKALGYTGLDTMYGASDGTINFNSDYSFDYDNSNGVGAGLVDFESIAAHEIGHLLGFSSEINYIDALVHSGDTMESIAPKTLDCLRFRNSAPNDPASAADFSTFSRSMSYNTDDVFDDTVTEYRMSTGAFNGDGRQAGHWKDNALTGVDIGLMDPNIAATEIRIVALSDVRALDLIGYDRLQCGNGIVEAGEQCDDSNVANGDCCSSTCQYEANLSACMSDGNSCTADVCNATGTCQHNALPNFTNCEDGLFCNGGDLCLAGVCQHIGNPCTAGPVCNNVCNEAADNCHVTAGTACSSDSNPCTNDVCSAGACTHPANTASCDDGAFCNGTDTCSGGTCSVHSGDPCSAGADCQDGCNEAADNCSATNGNACDDGVFCNGTDTCSAGTCSSHSGDPCTGGAECQDTCVEAADTCNAPDGTACSDDGEVCTDDTCDGAGGCEHVLDVGAAPQCVMFCPPEPQQGCLASIKQGFQLGDSADPGKDKMSWKWQKGDAMAAAAIGDPTGSTKYRLCIYDSTGPTATLLSGIGIDNAAGWTVSDKGAVYKDTLGAQDGVTGIKLKLGASGKSSVQIKRKGTLALPGPYTSATFFEPGKSIIVQLAASDGACWGGAFQVDAMKLNTGEKAKTTDDEYLCGDGSRDFLEECDLTDDVACPGLCSGCACNP